MGAFGKWVAHASVQAFQNPPRGQKIRKTANSASHMQDDHITADSFLQQVY